jgi:hypothetical protein
VLQVALDLDLVRLWKLHLHHSDVHLVREYLVEVRRAMREVFGYSLYKVEFVSNFCMLFGTDKLNLE